MAHNDFLVNLSTVFVLVFIFGTYAYISSNQHQTGKLVSARELQRKKFIDIVQNL